MAKSKDAISVHSPANDLQGGWGTGGGKQAPAPSVFPDINVSGKSGDSPNGSTFGDTDGRTPVSVEEVQLATGIPESYDAGLGDTLVQGLGTPPKA